MLKIPIADRYVLRQVSTPLAVSLSVGLMVLLSERLVRLLDVTLGKKNSFAIVFELLGYLVPHYLGLAIPAALFLGLLFGFNRMSKDSEIDAFLAAGIGMHRLARPVAMMAVTLALAALLVFGWLQPHTRYAYRALLFSIKNVDIFYLAEEGVFMQAGTRTFILDRLERQSNRFQRIFLFDDRKPDSAETITAGSGALTEREGDVRPVLRLENGHRLKLERWPSRDADEPLPQPTSSDFGQVDTPLGKASQLIFRRRGVDAREMTLPELFDHYNDPAADSASSAGEIRTEFHKRLVSVATILVLPFLALPFALGTRRGQRAYRFGVALVVLVAYHEILEQGAVISKVSGASPFLMLWLPFAALAGFAGWRFHATCFLLRRDRMQPLYDRLSDLIARIKLGILHQFGLRT